jgi:hypothetical protein
MKQCSINARKYQYVLLEEKYMLENKAGEAYSLKNWASPMYLINLGRDMENPCSM